MIADLKPYAEYKDSGLPWLGQVPGHWQTERAKWLFTKMNRPVQNGEEVVTCFRDGIVTLRRNRRLRGFTEATVFSGYQGIRNGDLVIHGMDAFAGAIGVSDSDGMGTPVYNVCQPRAGVNAGYYAHLVRQMSQSQWILALAKGIRERSTDFRFETFGNQRVSLPPPAEQAAIVRFLDWANGRLERASRAKRKVIALLNEQKQAIIHRAVTRGLDPSVPLKPSGIPWLGDIPAHWEVRRVKNFARSGYKTFVDGDWIESPFIRESGVRLIQTGNVGAGNYREKGFRYISEETFNEFGCTEILPGDVLICRLGEPVGRACLAPSLGVRMITSVDVCILKPSTAVNPAFAVYLMTSPGYLRWVGSLVRGSTRDRVSRSMLAGFTLPLPPIEEQAAIICFLNGACGELDGAISRLEREIDLLLEYRTRLVADVVTGKLDVREAAARLPDEEALVDIPDTDDPDDDLAADEKADA